MKSQDDTHDRVIELSEQVAQLEGLLNGAASTQSNHSDALNKLNLAQQELRDLLTMKSQDDTHDRVIELSEQVAQLEGLLNGAASTQSNHSDALNKLNLAQQELRDMLTMKSQDDTHDRVIELSEQVAQLEGLLNGAASTQSNHSDALNKLNLAQQELRDMLTMKSQDDTHDRVIELSEQVAQLEGLLNGAASTQSNHSDALNKLNLAQQELRDMLTMKSQELAHLSGATQTLRVEQKNLLQELSELSKGISLLQELSQAPRDETGMAKELSRAADDAQELREILGAQSELLNQLSNTYQAAVGVQEEHSQQLERLAQRMQSHPLTLDVEDVEEYIRQIARSKE